MSKGRAKFYLCERVRLTAKCKKNMGWSHRKQKGQDTGKVVGFSRDGYYVSVIRDGLKTRESYHPDYLEPELTDNPGERIER
jgi:ribosomal protein L21E